MSAIIDFLLRHRRKFIFAGTLVVGVSLINKYAANNIINWHQNHSHGLMAKQKRKQHYEKLRQTAISTVLGLSGSITKIITENLETDTVLQAIKTSSGDARLRLWDELKVLSFSRCIASSYVASLLSAVVHVKIMVLGGYSFNGATTNDDLGNHLTEDLQERYLLGIYTLIEFGLPLLTEAIRDHVQGVVSELALQRPLSLKQLETVLSDLCLLGQEEQTDADYILKSKHLCFQNLIDESSKWPESSKKQTLIKMLEETKEIIYTDDFRSLVLILVQNCLNHTLDHLADRFRMTPVVGSVSDTGQSNGLPLDGTLPIAKLLPTLSGIVTNNLSAAPGQLFSNVLVNSHLEAFSFNVYESFSGVP